jgi:hypothetical protein
MAFPSGVTILSHVTRAASANDFLLFVFCLVRWSRHLVLWSLETYGLRESE